MTYRFLYLAVLILKARRVSFMVANREAREDAQQEAWLQFLKFKPRTPTGAMLMARSAAINVLRKEMRQAQIPGRIKEGNHLKSRFTDRRRMRQQYLASHPRA